MEKSVRRLLSFDGRHFVCYDTNRSGVMSMDIAEYNQRREGYLQRIKQLRLFDDDFFTRCFEGSPECTELLLHIILEKPDLRVVEVKVQYTIKNLQGRSVRLDIFAVDSAGKRYNIEIQRDDRGAGARRARYNSSLVDANVLLVNDDVGTLPENFVIFITEHDVLGGSKPVYHIDRTIRETDSLFGDGSHILYVNGAWRDDSPVGKLMHDFSCTDPDSMNYALLADRVRYFKEDKEGVQTMSKIFEDFGKEMRDEGVKEGARGNLLENIKSLMETMHLTVEQAMDALRVPTEDRADITSRIAAP